MSIKSIFAKLFKSNVNAIEVEQKPLYDIAYVKKQYHLKKEAINNWLKDHLDHYCAKNNIEFSLENYNIQCPNCMSSFVETKSIYNLDGTETSIKYNHCNECCTDWEYNTGNYLELYNKFADIANFLDYIALHLIIGKFDPWDITCECDSEEEYNAMHLDYLKTHYKDVIENFPIEVVHYLGYHDKQCIFMTDEVFGKEYRNNQNLNTGYDVLGTFTPEVENIMVNLLKMKKLDIYE